MYPLSIFDNVTWKASVRCVCPELTPHIQLGLVRDDRVLVASWPPDINNGLMVYDGNGHFYRPDDFFHASSQDSKIGILIEEGHYKNMIALSSPVETGKKTVGQDRWTFNIYNHEELYASADDVVKYALQGVPRMGDLEDNKEFALKKINRYRAKRAQNSLNPELVGWTDDDVFIEFKRLFGKTVAEYMRENK